jgi:hypothetical protein
MRQVYIRLLSALGQVYYAFEEVLSIGFKTARFKTARLKTAGDEFV